MSSKLKKSSKYKKKHKKNCSFKIHKKNQVLVYFEFPTESAVFATILQEQKLGLHNNSKLYNCVLYLEYSRLFVGNKSIVIYCDSIISSLFCIM